MSNFRTPRTLDEDLSQSSDEKMDTGSESFRSQDTPNSVLSSDFEDKSIENNVLRLQNPQDTETGDVLRLSEPEHNDNIKPIVKLIEKNLSDSFVTRMSNLNLDSSTEKPENFNDQLSSLNLKGNLERPVKSDILSETFVNKMSKFNLNSPKLERPNLATAKLEQSNKQENRLNPNSPKENRPRHLGISPPKFSSSLVLTTNHPLMGLGSPDDFPDVVPKIAKEDEKELSLSSIEDERPTNGYDFYSPPMNTSKNNLYFSENFTTADGQILDSQHNSLPPDVAKVEKRRKIVPEFTEKREKVLDTTPHRVLGRIIDGKRDSSAIHKYIEERSKKLYSHSTPKSIVPAAIHIAEVDFSTGVAEWCESPSQLRSMPNFELPIELSSTVSLNNGLESPDVISSSTQEDKSAYQALLDPYTGSVALRPTVQRSPGAPRRRIQLPPEEDRCSLDSVSVSMDSEDEPPEPEPQVVEEKQLSDDDDTKQSRSTNTGSECSDPIPEYSAAEEFMAERSWVTVRSGGSHAACDMKVIEPFKRVLSHGGYDPQGSAIIVFSACHLPDNSRPDYRYVMDNLFLYVIWTLERLVTDEYILIYLHGSAGGGRLPTFRWLQECYRLIDRRLRKSLRHLFLVHPTFWLKTFVIVTKPFVSSKFFRKLSYVRTLDELMQRVPVEPNAIPDAVKQYDATR